MPTRIARYRELCRVCGEKTDEACHRCKAPLCPEHLPPGQKRCAACEAEYARWPSREPKVIAAGLLFATSWIILTLGLLQLSPVAAIIWALAFPTLVGIGAHRSLVSGRKIFLEQEKRKKMKSDERRLLH